MHSLFVVMCLVGNKSDLSDNREVSTEDAMEYASSIGALFCETSALKNTGSLAKFRKQLMKAI